MSPSKKKDLQALISVKLFAKRLKKSHFYFFIIMRDQDIYLKNVFMKYQFFVFSVNVSYMYVKNNLFILLKMHKNKLKRDLKVTKTNCLLL